MECTLFASCSTNASFVSRGQQSYNQVRILWVLKVTGDTPWRRVFSPSLAHATHPRVSAVAHTAPVFLPVHWAVPISTQIPPFSKDRQNQDKVLPSPHPLAAAASPVPRSLFTMSPTGRAPATLHLGGPSHTSSESTLPSSDSAPGEGLSCSHLAPLLGLPVPLQVLQCVFKCWISLCIRFRTPFYFLSFPYRILLIRLKIWPGLKNCPVFFLDTCLLGRLQPCTSAAFATAPEEHLKLSGFLLVLLSASSLS